MRRLTLLGFLLLAPCSASLLACSSASDQGFGDGGGGGNGGGGGSGGDGGGSQDGTMSGDGAPSDASDAGPFDQFQRRNLADINMYRATLGRAPLVLDETLCTFALAGSTLETMDHIPHQHFINSTDGGMIWMDGFNTQAGENQGDPNGWNVLDKTDETMNELDQIDAIQKAMFDEGPGDGEAHGHYENMMNAVFTKVGVGLIEVKTSMGEQLYLTNDFSN
jgi:Cysteine-rich secretory protein family